MEIKTDPTLIDPRLANLEIDSEDYRKIARAALKRQRKAERRRKTQRNAKNGTINHFKLNIINDMFKDEPQGYAYQDSYGRSYYHLNGTTVRM